MPVTCGVLRVTSGGRGGDVERPASRPAGGKRYPRAQLAEPPDVRQSGVTASFPAFPGGSESSASAGVIAAAP